MGQFIPITAFGRSLVDDVDAAAARATLGVAESPLDDATTIVKGSADATKLLRFEVDGFTTGTTRVLTPPNANATIAGLEVAQTFTTTQTIAQDGTLNNAFVIFSDTSSGGSSWVLYNRFTGVAGKFAITNLSTGAAFSIASDGVVTIVGNLSLTGTVGVTLDGTLNNVFFTMTDTASGGHLYAFVNRAFGQAGSFALYDYTASASRITVLADGKIGIGTDAPAAKIHVVGDTITGDGNALFFGLSSTSANRQRADITLANVDNTDATRKYRIVFNVWDTAVREGFRIEASGSGPKIGFLGAAAVIRPATTGTGATGYTQNASANAVVAESTFTGNSGATAYTISDIILALKQLGLLTA